MRPVEIIGAGFSGLTLAYALIKAGQKVELFDTAPQVGGLLQTLQIDGHTVEPAANGLLSDEAVEGLFRDLDLEILWSPTDLKKQIYRWGKPRTFPVALGELLSLLPTLWKLKTNKQKLSPRDSETLREWGVRVLGAALTDHVLEPAMTGVYASRSADLSATLVLKKLFASKPHGKKRGRTIGPRFGMRELTEALLKWLLKNGAEINLQTKAPPFAAGKIRVIALSAMQAAAELKSTHPELSGLLREIPLTSISTLTLLADEPRQRRAFGCLFPYSSSKIRGVLFNSALYPSRKETLNSETYIFSGEVITETAALKEAHAFRAEQGRPRREKHFYFRSWPHALPLYGIALENVLKKMNEVSAPGLYLHGNYLGELGLTSIFLNGLKLAQEISKANRR